MTRMMVAAAEVAFQALLQARGGNLQEVFRNSQARASRPCECAVPPSALPYR
jgi:hypothetical protein